MKQQLIQAAERGNAEAQFNLAIMYENGLVDSRYVAEGNHLEAMRWLLAAAEQSLNIKAGETTMDGNVSLVSARCIGSCSMAPALIFDGETIANASATVLRGKLEGWKD